MALAVSKRKSGFTIPEVVIALALAAALVAPLAIISVYFLSSMFDRSAEATLASEAQDILRSVSEDLRAASEIRSSNSINDPNRTGGWSTSLANGPLVFSSPALTNDRQIITDGSGDVRLNEFVYFKEGTGLYKRNLPFDGPGSNLLRRTCPATAVSSSCSADPVLTNNLTDITFTLYNSNGQVTTNTSVARSVLVQVELSKHSINGTVTVKKDIRVTMRKF